MTTIAASSLLLFIIVPASFSRPCLARRHVVGHHRHLRGPLPPSSSDIIIDDVDVPSDDDHAAEPSLADCLLSAINSEDCGSIVMGCHWCAEPLYGLCVTKDAAMRMKNLPFFECDVVGDVEMLAIS